MSKRPNWDNYIMRKYARSIRDNIAEAYGVFAKAVIIVKREQTLGEIMKQIPDDKWKAA